MAEKTLEQMREAVEEIRAKMAAAAREAGRDPAAVQLCGSELIYSFFPFCHPYILFFIFKQASG